MRSKEQVRTDFTESTRQLLSVLSSFPEAHFNTQIIDEKWSAGEIAEHLIKVEVGSTRFFTGKKKETKRNPEEKIEQLRVTFLNFDDKLTAPGLIMPDSNSKDKQEAIEKLQDNRQRLTSMIEIEDLTKLLTAFDHPFMGPLTRIEWLYFHIFHSKRHAAQIKTLMNHIVTNKE